MKTTPDSRPALTDAQRAFLTRQIGYELTENLVYLRIARLAPPGKNRDLLTRIAAEERGHAARLTAILGGGGRAKPDRFKVFRAVAVTRLFGLTFGLKLMELGEVNAGANYRSLAAVRPEFDRFARDEDEHEAALLALLDDERLTYMGAIVLGLNDALVELTGALAGFTFALHGSRLIAMTGLITGLAAAMSMASSSFLQARADGAASDRHPGKTACYTGAAYAATVFILILPYLLIPNVHLALGLMLLAALGIIACFNFYLSVAKGIPFRRSFLEMAGLSTGVAAVSFGIGYLLNHAFGAG
ncbi:MAG: VIT1/CCC1 family protein [Verrucomicrobiota bacterium]|jgi:VIT1/CCC1 family predicted Fe2+/Mn2+ transporter|nr:VIT1/CCC1 family protein [Verrucomicrobiota bacterium]